MHPDVLEIFSDFEIFISRFWTLEYKQQHRYINDTPKNPKTVQNYFDILTDLKNALPTLKTYHQLLNIFGEIDDTTYQLNINEFENQEKEILHLLQIITTKLDVTYTIDDLRRGEPYAHFKPIETYFSNLETKFYTRGYFINPVKQWNKLTSDSLFVGQILTIGQAVTPTTIATTSTTTNEVPTQGTLLNGQVIDATITEKTVDTGANIETVDEKIAHLLANDDSVKATSLILNYFVEAIKEGKK